MTLTDFLLARIAEDEHTARVASNLSTIDAVRRAARFYDPARVLAECEAKRRIVELLRGVIEHFKADIGGEGPLVAVECLEALALPYADHPDYRDEWRP